MAEALEARVAALEERIERMQQHLSQTATAVASVANSVALVAAPATRPHLIRHFTELAEMADHENSPAAAVIFRGAVKLMRLKPGT